MPESAMQVVERHQAAIRRRDLDAIVAGYAPDAVLADTNRIGRGHDHIRAVHEAVLDAAAALRPSMDLIAAGDVVFVSWRAETPDGTTELVGTNTFVVSGGLITVSTGFITSAAFARRLDEVA